MSEGGSEKQASAVYAGPERDWPAWRDALSAAAADAALDLAVAPVAEADPARAEYLLFAPDGPVADLGRYAHVRAILCLWAGVDAILARADLPSATPLVRMVEPGLEQGMVEYVLAHSLRAHLEIDRLRADSAAGRWAPQTPRLAPKRHVGVLGLGALGRAVADALQRVGFQVSGWSRTPKHVEGVDTRHGLDALTPFLAEAEILVVLLPLTPETAGLLNVERLGAMPQGAHLINVARGAIVVEKDLLTALETGLGGATLDVFETEPLPPDHPFWGDPRILITPHIASVTRPKTASRSIVRSIQRLQQGLPLDAVVDRARGY